MTTEGRQSGAAKTAHRPESTAITVMDKIDLLPVTRIIENLRSLERMFRSEADQDRENGFEAAAMIRLRRAIELAEAIAFITRPSPSPVDRGELVEALIAARDFVNEGSGFPAALADQIDAALNASPTPQVESSQAARELLAAQYREFGLSDVADALLAGGPHGPQERAAIRAIERALQSSQSGARETIEGVDEAISRLCDLHRKMLLAVKARMPYPVTIALGNSDLDTVLDGAIALERAKAPLPHPARDQAEDEPSEPEGLDSYFAIIHPRNGEDTWPPEEAAGDQVREALERDAARWRFTQREGYFYTTNEYIHSTTGLTWAVGIQAESASVNESILGRGETLCEAIDAALASPTGTPESKP